MSIKKRVINKVSDVLSYPSRTLSNARASSSNALADSYLLKKAKLKADKASIGRYKPTKLR
jgi:hypothetical protein